MTSKRAAIHEVAKLAGVSIATVSRVANGHYEKVSDQTRERVETIISALNFRPSSAGSNLRRGTSRILAVIINDRESSYNLAIVASIEEAAKRADKVMVLCATQDSPERQDEFLAEMQAQLAWGIVIIGAVKSHGLKAALKSKQPIVFVNRHCPFATEAPYIGVNNIQAAEEVARHFKSLGHHQATLFHGPRVSSATDERVRGFETAYLADKHLHKTKLRRCAMPNFKMNSAYVAARELLAQGKMTKAVFCTNDDLAYGVARACREHGLDPATEMTLFGFDGNPYNPYVAPWLSTVQAESSAYGENVLRALSDLSANEAGPATVNVMIPYKIILSRPQPAL